MITYETSRRIAYLYQEIEAGEKLLAEVMEALSEKRLPDFRDSFGRQRGLQLGVPSGENSRRLFDVDPGLAQIVVSAEMDRKRAEIKALCEVARAELEKSEHQ